MGLAAGSVILIGTSASAVAPRSTKAVPLDHFLCYAAQAPNFATPQKVTLKNFLNPTPFTPVFTAVSAHCNPTIKKVTTSAGTKTFKVFHPAAHLLCWSISFLNHPQLVHLANQFGKATMIVYSPSKLCVPSWKSKTGPPNMKPVDPPNLDHFTCYPLKPSTALKYGFRQSGTIKVEDEFSAPRFLSVKIQLANQLCVPTTKFYQGVIYAPVSSADHSLVCFPINKTPYWKTAYDQNQFGSAAVFPTAPPEELCAPSIATL